MGEGLGFRVQNLGFGGQGVRIRDWEFEAWG
jgi:hypothetical protein